jgi:hypothetical protein
VPTDAVGKVPSCRLTKAHIGTLFKRNAVSPTDDNPAMPQNIPLDTVIRHLRSLKVSTGIESRLASKVCLAQWILNHKYARRIGHPTLATHRSLFAMAANLWPSVRPVRRHRSSRRSGMGHLGIDRIYHGPSKRIYQDQKLCLIHPPRLRFI